MASNSHSGFVHDFDPSSDNNFRMLSFQTDVMNPTEEMNSGVMCSSSGNNNAVGSFPSGSPDIFGNSSAAFNAGTSFGSGQREWVHGLKHDIRLAVDWTYEEQNMLNEGLISWKIDILEFILVKNTELPYPTNFEDWPYFSNGENCLRLIHVSVF
ncbi:hypothetical protein MA16_Dca002177 [Dendrobium catenatum]|uniref:Uncharacterized protein n=1 Tax=Dendrobium catenatum TaxID=906689 RepID=A0A2I0XEK5_9ASPA|nr:hypothetical protein MA16_Dca002177 [Dendrobium catenatum]